MRGIVFGCFAESVPKSSFRDLGTKREPKESQKGAKRDPKGIQKGAKGSQKGANGDLYAYKNRSSENVSKRSEKGGARPRLLGAILFQIP